MGSESGLDSALVPSATDLVSDFHSVSGLALESDSPAEPDSELAPEFDSASDFQSEPRAESLEQLLQYPLLRASEEFVCLALLATEQTNTSSLYLGRASVSTDRASCAHASRRSPVESPEWLKASSPVYPSEMQRLCNRLWSKPRYGLIFRQPL